MRSGREWIGFSDLMSVLMMVFLFIAILFMLRVEDNAARLREQHAAMRQVAETYDETRHGLRDALHAAFAEDFRRWDAEVLADGTVRFNQTQALFTVGSSVPTPRFEAILQNFFPRYVAVLASRGWREDISEIRIEGHTSSDWGGEEEIGARYMRNAELSQERAFAVWRYVYELPAAAEHRPWLRRVLRAAGMADAEPVLTDGTEDPQRSRRVEFHARTKADEKMYDILRHARGAAGGL